MITMAGTIVGVSAACMYLISGPVIALFIYVHPIDPGLVESAADNRDF
jgi:hypothetical protein